MWIIGPGDLVGRRYRIERELGAGGMAYVFAARDEELGEPVAIKIIRPELASDPDLVERFKREVRIARQIHHPNVVRIFEFGRTEHEGRELYYMTMELLSGVDLKKRRARSLAEVLDLGIQICEGLEAAHRAGVVHRDVKPQNVFVDEAGRARVMDFGISRLATLTGLTRGSQSMGTPHYMSPEQARGSKDIDHRTDIYSVGVVLYELATGKLPFDGKTPVEVALRHLQDPPPEPRRINPRVPGALERVILTCLAKEPERRYASAAELASELSRMRDALAGETILIDASGRMDADVVPTLRKGEPRAPDSSESELVTTRRSRNAKSRRLPLYLTVAGVVLGLAVTGFLVFRPRPSKEPIEEAKVEPAPEELPQPPPTSTSAPPALRAQPATTVRPTPASSAPAPPAPEAPLDVRISANPGTEIHVDGELAGVVPPIVELSLLPGRHRILYRIPDYEELETEVDVRAGATNSFSHRFPPYAVLRVVAQPYARVELDGKDLGFTPVNLPKVREGEHRLRLHREGFDSIETTIVVKPGEVNVHRFEMKR
jgi:serine/threonine-protein kinase